MNIIWRASRCPVWCKHSSEVFSIVHIVFRILRIALLCVFCAESWDLYCRMCSLAERSKVRVARLLGLRARIPLEAWSVCEFCVLSGKGSCDGLIPRPEESYRLWYVIVCDLELSRKRRPCPALGCCVRGEYALCRFNFCNAEHLNLTIAIKE